MSETIIQGDCLEVMRGMDAESVTAIVTDPPYGLEFMGKEWDRLGEPKGFRRKENPADTGRDNVFGRTSRTSPEYAAGAQMQEWHRLWAVEALRVLKPGGHALVFGGTRTYHRLACALEDAGFEIRDCLMWLYGQGFPKSLDVSKAIDKAAGAERDVVGIARAGQSSLQRVARVAQGYRENLTNCTPENIPITAPATDAAKHWAGYGTALKPAWEPILLARKPLIGTVERNCREHGTGALNIDGCRIGTEGGGTHCTNRDENGRCKGHQNAGRSTSGETFHGPETEGGRWPANLVLDKAAAEQLDAQTGVLKSGIYTGHRNKPKTKNSFGAFELRDEEPQTYGDSGGASRFFYCSKASKRDRGDGNSHPTVKPISLMRWLVRLIRGPGENLVLDPFAGSGTTGVACALEEVPCVLVEREAEYVEIIRRRLQEVTP